MQWIDIAAGISAARHAGGPVVTASMDRLHFLAPDPPRRGRDRPGAGRTSPGRRRWRSACACMAEDQSAQGRRQTTRAFLTFVAVDENGRPRPVPAAVARDRRRSAPLRRRAHPPRRAPARGARYEERVTRTADLDALARDAVAAPRHRPRADRRDRRGPQPFPATASSPATSPARPSAAAACRRCSPPRATSSRTCASSCARTTSGSSSTPARPSRSRARCRATRSWTTSPRRRGPTSRSRRCSGPAAAARLAAIGADPGALATAPLLAHAQVTTPRGRALDRARARAGQRTVSGWALRSAVLAEVHARLVAAGTPRARARRRRGGPHRRARAALRRRDHARLLSDGGRARRPPSTTARAATSARNRSSASATAATSTGGWSASTSPGPPIPPPPTRSRATPSRRPAA